MYQNLLEESAMFYQVKIYHPDGKLKSTVSKKQLTEKHWEDFEQAESNIGLLTRAQKPVPAWVKAKLDKIYPVSGDSSY